ncbi:DUF922 domain-containing protein [Muriicola soli]|uniref:DUF922 domain-containing protein n=1 Tax=Muriicola soli TaxID=2507538 RepID=UPI001FEA2CD4|nr:DUF922 domain-containing protein [Muriicola soli]
MEKRLTSLGIIFFFLCLTQVYGQEDGSILWDSSHRLSWTDFKSPPPANSRIAATTASGIAYQFSALEQAGKMEVDCSIQAYFYPEASWYRPEVATDNILSHEQLHFDISELYARKMRTRVQGYTFSSNVKAEMRKIYSEILKELREFQSRYDEETNYSRAVEKQVEWNVMIAKALNKTSG